ncbi:CLUMA_CG008684, isoform A [Clunio marinus]|uniref:CLUMA_CG008684, isoform A n=1 Tax=Clunio marinus TaxID=568069 RepID=A0A1J1I4P1_9DIPT|nr:CLUMA_CG008684, isoform A [Clunio marinus]
MKPVICVRRYDDKDNYKVKEIIRNFVLSRFSAAFWFCIFREITLQLIVLATAMFFIFFGIPLIYCISSVPIVIIMIGICVYASHYNKAIEMSNMHTPICFVAEVHEPFFLRLNKKEIEYSVMTEEEVAKNQEVRKMTKKIVGTVSIKNHNSLHDSAWLYRLAIDPDYPFNIIAKSLVEAAMKHAHQHHLYTCETVSEECHEDFREVLLKIGFLIRQIYHKSIIGSSLRIMKAQMGIDLDKFFRNKKSSLDAKSDEQEY